MSVKDLIWINIGQALKIRRSGERELERFKADLKMLDTIYLAICDCRELAANTNYFCRVAALKGTKVRKIDPFDTIQLPSVAVEEERKEAERRAKMTPEELAEEEFRDFMAGKKVRRKVN